MFIYFVLYLFFIPPCWQSLYLNQLTIYISSFNLPLPLLCKIKVFQVEKIMLLRLHPDQRGDCGNWYHAETKSTSLNGDLCFRIMFFYTCMLWSLLALRAINCCMGCCIWTALPFNCIELSFKTLWLPRSDCLFSPIAAKHESF